MCRITRNIEINVMAVKETPVERRTAGKNTSADGIGTNKDDHFGVRNGIVADLQGFCHVGSYRTCNDYSICMPGRGNKFNSEPSHVELYIVGGIEFPFAAV